MMVYWETPEIALYSSPILPIQAFGRGFWSSPDDPEIRHIPRARREPTKQPALAQRKARQVYLVSLCSVWMWQNLQYLRKASFSGVVRLFLVVV
jgi:hypothetical protein